MVNLSRFELGQIAGAMINCQCRLHLIYLSQVPHIISNRYVGIYYKLPIICQMNCTQVDINGNFETCISRIRMSPVTFGNPEIGLVLFRNKMSDCPFNNELIRD